MNHLELLTTTGWFTLLLLSFYFFGSRFITHSTKRIEDYGIAVLIGITIYGYAVLVLGLSGALNLESLITTILLMLLFGAYRYKHSNISVQLSWTSIIFLVLTLLILGTTYLTSMQPPHTSDELNYHFPQALRIANEKLINLEFDGHYFYGNIPKHLEIIFASGIILDSYSLAHSLHYIYLLSTIIAVWGIIYSIYGSKAASITTFLLLNYEDLLWNSSSGFVDGAAFSLEILSLILIARYFYDNGYIRDIKLAGLLIGSGLAIKYSVGVTALFIAATLIPRKNLLPTFVGSSIIMGGFWYAKNILLYGNPFYPLYLGHKGVSEQEYKLLLDNIQQFEHKSIDNFVEKMGYFKEFSRIPIYYSMIISPLVLFIRKNIFTQILFIYFLTYTAYWYMLGTHQLRFYAPAVMVSLVLSGIIISKFRGSIIMTLFLIVNIILYSNSYFNQTLGSYYWGKRFNLVGRQYALGNISLDDFMYRWYGCYYSAVDELESYQPGYVIDNYSPGIEFNVPFYANKQKWITSNMIDLDSNNEMPIYYYYRDSTKILNERQGLLPNDDYKIFRDHMQLTWSKDDCYVYVLEL